jgi:hypothetical protein
LKKISRRSFARDALVAATAAAAFPAVDGLAMAAEPPAATPNAEVEARINWIFTKYGSRLSDEQRADIRRIISGGQGSIDAMRAYPLGNEIGPPVPFRVYSAKRRRPRAKTEGK